MGKTIQLSWLSGALLALSALLLWLQSSGQWVPADWPMTAMTHSLVVLLGIQVLSVLLRGLHTRVQAGEGRWGFLRRWLKAEDDRSLHEIHWLYWTFQLLLWTALPLLLLRVWGLADQSQQLFSTLVANGFKIGESHIVPGQLLLGILLFSSLVTVTRWIKHRLRNDWLHHTPMHPGTREAVATMFGYLTFIFALLIGLSFAGFDFGNLALVAGALGVGIGFGLQNIVNNFISGLILLFERPIRPGDFISVGETTGFVRKVSIRSTELETLDRMSVIVPNSDMLANHVQNWTLRDPFGRINVTVGVAYGSDTEKVKEILLEVADNNPDVVNKGHAFIPAPSALFTGFGDSSLNFELRVFIRQIERRWVIASDLNFAIDAAFRANGITIPFPQRDLWFRNPTPEPEA